MCLCWWCLVSGLWRRNVVQNSNEDGEENSSPFFLLCFILYRYMMETTIFLAQLLCWVFAVLWVSLFLNPAWYDSITKDILKSPSMIHMGSFLSLAMWVTIVLVHNVWDYSVALIITLFGWANIVKAIVPLWFPAWTVVMTKKLPMNAWLLKVGGLVFVILAVLLYGLGYGF